MAKHNAKTCLSEQQRLEMFGWILADSVYDLSIPAEVFRGYCAHSSENPPNKMLEGVVRMCRQSTVIGICKLYDAFRSYGDLLQNSPEELRERISKFLKHVEQKNYKFLRSKFIAHNFDAYEKYTYQDGQDAAESIFGSSVGELLEYLAWVKPANGSGYEGRYFPAFIASDAKEYVRGLVDLKPRVSMRNAEKD
ncbi:hypothetical protein [Pseudomonas sp.]|uniref:hypothetical protein n=1 Tax=Pseudomonas sp. TaxID=306 RepID=UPI0025854780|nr:hypothetical protein [Pseudomonas sp.]